MDSHVCGIVGEGDNMSILKDQIGTIEKENRMEQEKKTILPMHEYLECVIKRSIKNEITVIASGVVDGIGHELRSKSIKNGSVSGVVGTGVLSTPYLLTNRVYIDDYAYTDTGKIYVEKPIIWPKSFKSKAYPVEIVLDHNQPYSATSTLKHYYIKFVSGIIKHISKTAAKNKEFIALLLESARASVISYFKIDESKESLDLQLQIPKDAGKKRSPGHRLPSMHTFEYSVRFCYESRTSHRQQVPSMNLIIIDRDTIDKEIKRVHERIKEDNEWFLEYQKKKKVEEEIVDLLHRAIYKDY